MKSSSGKHYIALDHLRALAAFLVFVWHFTHGTNETNGYPVPFEGAPQLFFFAIIIEGYRTVDYRLYHRLYGT